jgi:Fe-S-cluster containining protein
MSTFPKRPDPQRPSEWKRYTTGMCDGCIGGCCQLPLEASAFDLIRLGVATEDEAATSLKKLARRLMKAGIVRSFHSSAQIFIIEQRNGKHGADCIYLDEHTRRCTVYAKRPEVCRQFPKIGPRPGWCPAAPIPGSKKSLGR